MEQRRIKDLLTPVEKRLYKKLTKELMFCTTDAERTIINNKVADLLQGAIERQIPNNNEHAATLETSAL